jgi:hypothetical protein
MANTDVLQQEHRLVKKRLILFLMELSKTYSEIGGTLQRPFSLLPDRVYEYIIDCYLVFIFL